MSLEVRLTILMPTYNKEMYIRQAIESVLMQKTQHQFNLLIIDDKSTDNSLSIAKEYQYKYPNLIKIIEKERNEGCLSTILKGYECTKSDYFTVLDPDDYWTSSQKIENAIEYLDVNQEYTMYVANTLINEGDTSRQYYSINDVMDFDFYDLDEIILGHTSGTIFRNVIFKKGVPEYIYKKIGTKYEACTRGDSFRNLIHLSEGKMHIVNDVESVYRITGDGIWTKLNKFQQNVMNAEFYMSMFEYFKGNQGNIFISKCWGFCVGNIMLGSGDTASVAVTSIDHEYLIRFYEVLSECAQHLKMQYRVDLVDGVEERVNVSRFIRCLGRLKSVCKKIIALN